MDGAEYRLSFDGSQADLITSEGALDLTGLTITALAEPTGRIYAILHAAGGLSGEKPSLVGLPSKWHLISKANDVYLAKKVGTCLTVY